jgi:hypothetical protein
MVPTSILCIGKIDQRSNKDESDDDRNPAMKFRHLEYFVAAAE